MASVTRARLAVVGAALLFSTGGAAIKWSTLPALELAGLRAAIAAVTLLVLLRLPWRSFEPAAVVTGGAQAASMTLFVVGNKLTTAANTIFLQATAPLYVLLASPRLLGERIARRDLLFLALFAVGLALFFVDAGPAQATAPRPLLGNVAALCSGAAWAATMLGLRWLALRRLRRQDLAPAASGTGRPLPTRRAVDPVAAATVLGNVLVALACLPWLVRLPALGGTDLAVALWLGVFQVGAAYALLSYGVRHVRAFDATMLMLVEPVLNPVWAWLVHRETPGAWVLAGGAIVLATTAARTWYNPPP